MCLHPSGRVSLGLERSRGCDVPGHAVALGHRHSPLLPLHCGKARPVFPLQPLPLSYAGAGRRALLLLGCRILPTTAQKQRRLLWARPLAGGVWRHHTRRVLQPARADAVGLVTLVLLHGTSCGSRDLPHHHEAARTCATLCRPRPSVNMARRRRRRRIATYDFTFVWTCFLFCGCVGWAKVRSFVHFLLSLFTPSFSFSFGLTVFLFLD